MNSPTTTQGSAARWLLLLFVRFYQIFFSPFLGGACKFYPSCSRYAQEAIEMHGARRGAWLAMKRLGRCRPFTKGGFDPVPEVSEKKEFVREQVGAENERARGTSAAKAARAHGEVYVVAKATTHKATTYNAAIQEPAMDEATTYKAANYESATRDAKSYGWSDYSDAEWLRTVGKERAQ